MEAFLGASHFHPFVLEPLEAARFYNAPNLPHISAIMRFVAFFYVIYRKFLPSNKALQPTRVGAFSSAFAVHGFSSRVAELWSLDGAAYDFSEHQH